MDRNRVLSSLCNDADRGSTPSMTELALGMTQELHKGHTPVLMLEEGQCVKMGKIKLVHTCL